MLVEKKCTTPLKVDRLESPSVIKWQHSWNSEKVSDGETANGGGVSRKMGWWSQVGKRKKKIAEADVNNNFWRSIHVLRWIHADWLNIVLGLRASNQCVLFSVGRVPMYNILKFVYDISSGTKCEQHLQCKFSARLVRRLREERAKRMIFAGKIS